MKLEDFLVAGQYITSGQLDEAIKTLGDNSDATLGEIIIANKYIPFPRISSLLDDLVDFLAKNSEHVDQSTGLIDYSLAKELGVDYMRANKVFPLGKVPIRGGLGVKVMIEDPGNVGALDWVKNKFRSTVEPAKTRSFHSDLFEILIAKAGAMPEETIRIIGTREEKAASRRDADDEKVVAFTDRIIAAGIGYEASDVHLERYRDECRVRYRIDGELLKTHNVPESMYGAVVSRIKIMSGLDIAERRLPQGGKFKVENKDKGEYDVRVSMVPAEFGESVVLRLLSKEYINNLSLNNLGMPEHLVEQYREALHRPWGLLLVTGPTGSGKSTTLYASLKEKMEHDPNSKICTAEDPVEYTLPWLTQVAVNPKINLTFPLILEHFLRQDPDTIMVGEMRDQESAQLAIQAAQTGHLVLSTLHTNNAAQAIERLKYMGVEPTLLAPTLLGVVGQRLVRKICEGCIVEEPVLDPELFREMELEPKSFRGEGCAQCYFTGYKGRIGLYEFFPFHPVGVNDIGSPQGIEKLQRDRDVVSLQKYGLLKVTQGKTTLPEVLANTMD